MMAYDPYAPTGGGLLGNAFSSPLMQFGLGLLAQPNISDKPISPLQSIGAAGLAATEAQQKAVENQLYRVKIAQAQRQQQASDQLQEFIRSSKTPLVAGLPNDVLASALAAQPEAVGHLIPQSPDLATQAQLAKIQYDIEHGRSESSTPGGS